MKNQWLFILAFALLSVGCSSFKSTVSIPPYQEFILGEDEQAGFRVELTNISKYEVKVETRNANNEKTSGFGLDAKGKTKVYVDQMEKAVLKNPNSKPIKVQAKLTRGIQGMTYQVMDLKEVQKEAGLKASDLAMLVSDDWKGTLTYLDYSSGKEVNIPCDLKVGALNNESYPFEYIYPDEPGANSKAEAMIDEQNQTFEGRKVISYEKDAAQIVIKTVKEDRDDNKAAMLFYTYTITDNTFTIKKEFQTMGSSELKFRNIYAFKK